MLFAYEPALQPNADFMKGKLGDKARAGLVNARQSV
jgi:hypothetical protein